MKRRPPPVLPNDVGQLIRDDFPHLWRAHQERPLRTSKAAGALGEGMGHIRQSVPIRILPDHLANGVGSREAARLVRCRVRTGAPDGRAPGKMRSGVQPTSGGQPRSPSEVKCFLKGPGPLLDTSWAGWKLTYIWWLSH